MINRSQKNHIHIPSYETRKLSLALLVVSIPSDGNGTTVTSDLVFAHLATKKSINEHLITVLQLMILLI